MKKIYCCFLVGLLRGGVCTGNKADCFVPPFDFPLTLSGNFGEIRSNHFHGGLDFKTGGTIGKPVQRLLTGIFLV